MRWLQKIVDRVCKDIGTLNQKDGSIRVQNYSITIVNDSELYLIKITDLFDVRSPKIVGPLYHDEVEDYLTTTVKSI